MRVSENPEVPIELMGSWVTEIGTVIDQASEFGICVRVFGCVRLLILCVNVYMCVHAHVCTCVCVCLCVCVCVCVDVCVVCSYMYMYVYVCVVSVFIMC